MRNGNPFDKWCTPKLEVGVTGCNENSGKKSFHKKSPPLFFSLSHLLLRLDEQIAIPTSVTKILVATASWVAHVV